MRVTVRFEFSNGEASGDASMAIEMPVGAEDLKNILLDALQVQAALVIDKAIEAYNTAESAGPEPKATADAKPATPEE